MGEDARLTASVNEEYFVRVDAVVYFHARGTEGHAEHGQADGIRSGCEQASDLCRWNVAFDDIAFHAGGMTGRELARHSQPLAFRSGIRDIFRRDGKAGRSHVLDPGATAAAGRTLVDKNLGADGGRQPAMRQGEGGERQKKTASNHFAVTLPVIPASKWPGIRQAKPISPDLSNVQIISPVLPGSTWTM